jgi:hypothetical protein
MTTHLFRCVEFLGTVFHASIPGVAACGTWLVGRTPALFVILAVFLLFLLRRHRC